MTLEDRKNIAETIQELYLYPNCPKVECAMRILAWIISWIFGVVIPEVISAQTLGGCYFVLSISLLVDFFTEKRTKRLANMIYGLFCALLILTALGAIILIAKAPPTENVVPGQLYMFASKSLKWWGIGLFIIMFVNLVCVLAEVHKLIYDKEVEAKREEEKESKDIEAQQETIRVGFMGNLHGPSRGGEK